MDRRPTKIPFSNALPSNHGNESTSTTTPAEKRLLVGSGEMDPDRRCRTTTLRPVPSTKISMDFGEAIRHESLPPLTRCDRCGLEFGSASIVLHRKTCRCSSRRQTKKSWRDGQRKGTDTSVEVSGKAKEGARKETAVTLLDSPSLEQVAGVRMFGEQCKFCGERFSRHSLQLHMKYCREASGVPKMYTVVEQPSTESSKLRSAGATVGATLESSVVGAVELSRNLSQHVQLLELPQQMRPRTRSLDHSALLDRGLTLPSINGPSSVSRCGTCREVIDTGSLTAHRKTCRPSPRTVTKGEITFPALTPRPRMTTSTSHRPQPNSQVATNLKKRPTTVVCYICGREYGSKSISIHEPQCLKRFELENSQLPVNERKPLPKKSITHPAILAPQQHKIVTGTIHVEAYRTDVLQTAAEDYFQYCYREWEKELVPCKKCGRKFAPERHVKHAPRCRAKPLPDLAQN